MLSFSLKSPPYIAVCIGDNYMLVFGTSGQHSHEDVGLTFPEDYGAIAGYRWMANNVLLVGCVSQMRENLGVASVLDA